MSTVLLTGANGFIAVPITRILLERGYTVVGTVRSLSKTDFLRKKFESYGDKLQFAVVEDITVPGAFDNVLKQYAFDAVLHASSPFVFNINDVEKDLYEPAVKGTTEILKAVHAHAPTVKRVVITSSFAAMVDMKSNRPGYVYTEADWNPMSYQDGLSDPMSGYFCSKKLAEEVAWEFLKNENPSFAITTICPPMVYGPPEQEVESIAKINTSSQHLYGMMHGLAPLRTGVWLWVDVRDAALAHVLAIESKAAANQRYLVTEGRFSPQQYADFMWTNHPEEAEQRGTEKGTPGQLFPDGGVYTADNSKSIKDLGMTYHSLDQMLADTYASYKELEAKLA